MFSEVVGHVAPSLTCQTNLPIGSIKFSLLSHNFEPNLGVIDDQDVRNSETLWWPIILIPSVIIVLILLNSFRYMNKLILMISVKTPLKLDKLQKAN